MKNKAGFCRAVEGEREVLATTRQESRAKVEKRMDDDGNESRVIVGYAAVYYREGEAGTVYMLWDDFEERIMPGAFDRAISEKHDARGLFNHDSNNLLGRVSSGTMTLSVDDIGIRYEIPVDPEDSDSVRVASKIARGDLTGSSFAFVPRRVTYVEIDEMVVRQVEDVDLYDVGPVTWPAYDGTSAGMRSADAKEIRDDFDRWKADREAERLPDDVDVALSLVRCRE